MTRAARVTWAFFSIFVFFLMGWGVLRAFHSKLFLLKQVQVVRPGSRAAEVDGLDDRAIVRLAEVLPGKVSLYDLDLTAIRRRLLSEDWIQEVGLRKKFPDTLLISVNFREPKAMFQNSKGNLVYLDENGNSFGAVNLMNATDFTIFSRIPDSAKSREALLLVNKWEHLGLSRVSSLASITWDPEKGYRLLAVYSLNSGGPSEEKKGFQKNNYFRQPCRVMIDFGSNIDGSLDEKMNRLSSVIVYLSERSIAAHQISADLGRKIVVKTISSEPNPS